MDSMLASVDVRKSESRDPNVKSRVLDAVEQRYDDVNNHVVQCLHSWFMHQIDILCKADNFYRAEAQKFLGMRHMKLGDYESARPLLRAALDDCISMKGKKNRVTLLYMCNYALLMYKMKDYEEAITLYRKCVEISEEVIGEKDVNTIKRISNLGACYCKRGNSTETAISLYEKCLLLRQEVLGEKHFDTFSTMKHLAALYFSIQKYEEALSFCEKCVALRKEMLGETHPDTVNLMNSLASLYIMLGRYDEAISICNKVLDIRRVVLGEKHCDAVVSMDNLAYLYQKYG